MRRTLCGLAFGFFAIAGGSPSCAGETGELLAAIKAVGNNGKGNLESQQAVKKLIEQDAAVLPDILEAFDGANPIAANWLRGAFESIADREIQGGGKLPAAELEAFVKNTGRNPRARRLAFEWLAKIDTSAGERLIPGMLRDPGPEFRRDAVARLLEKAKSLDAEKQKDELIAMYREALLGATDKDQVVAIIEPLRKLGQEVDLKTHFGFVTNWSAVGPFDNKEGKGFGASYPPEKKFDLEATYKGQLGDVQWEPLTTNDDYGLLDIAKSIGPHKGAVIYLATEFHAAEGGPVEIRLGTPNAWKLWVNGKLAFAREEYHRGSGLDQYRVPAELQSGRNSILLKLCQNEQKEEWAQDYKFQLRICNASGVAVLPAVAPKDRTSTKDASGAKN